MTDTDYYRKEIDDVIASNRNDNGHTYTAKVKVFGRRDSKHLDVSVDALRNLADAMDTDRPPSLLPMMNGSRVLRADVRFDDRGVGSGVVLAERDGQFVTWRVYLHKGECRWLAETGDYSSNIERAEADYNERRGVTVTA